MLDTLRSPPSGIATSRVKYATNRNNNNDVYENENENVLCHAKTKANAMTMNSTVPCVSLRSRFASEFKSPPRSPLGEIKEGRTSRRETPMRGTPKKNGIGSPFVDGTPSKAKEGGDTLAKAFEYAKDCAMWNTPAKSCLAFTSGFLVLLTWHYAQTGIISFRPSVSAAYCGLSMLAVNFFGGIFIRGYDPKPVMTRGQVKSFTKTLESALLSLVPRVNRAFSGSSATATLQIAFSMWTLITLSKFMSLSLICLVGHCAAFTLPLLYKSFEEDIRRNLVIGKKLALGMWNGIHLDRKYKLTTVGAALGYLWFLVDVHTKMVSLFLAVIAFKCFLLPDEVETITSVAAPMTTRVSRKARRISMGASQIMRDTMSLAQLVSPSKPSTPSN
ncbi:reticulon-like protein [Chloropicon primus]|nr:reticulon-like protein [Chloropicon primus]